MLGLFKKIKAFFNGGTGVRGTTTPSANSTIDYNPNGGKSPETRKVETKNPNYNPSYKYELENSLKNAEYALSIGNIESVPKYLVQAKQTIVSATRSGHDLDENIVSNISERIGKIEKEAQTKRFYNALSDGNWQLHNGLVYRAIIWRSIAKERASELERTYSIETDDKKVLYSRIGELDSAIHRALVERKELKSSKKGADLDAKLGNAIYQAQRGNFELALKYRNDFISGCNRYGIRNLPAEIEHINKLTSRDVYETILNLPPIEEAQLYLPKLRKRLAEKDEQVENNEAPLKFLTRIRNSTSETANIDNIVSYGVEKEVAELEEMLHQKPFDYASKIHQQNQRYGFLDRANRWNERLKEKKDYEALDRDSKIWGLDLTEMNKTNRKFAKLIDSAEHYLKDGFVLRCQWDKSDEAKKCYNLARKYKNKAVKYADRKGISYSQKEIHDIERRYWEGVAGKFRQ